MTKRGTYLLLINPLDIELNNFIFIYSILSHYNADNIYFKLSIYFKLISILCSRWKWNQKNY